jgi:hypothetical protein
VIEAVLTRQVLGNGTRQGVETRLPRQRRFGRKHCELPVRLVRQIKFVQELGQSVFQR